MSGEPPKLFTIKPKKSKKATAALAGMTSQSAGDSAPLHTPAPPNPPQPLKKESFIRRYRFLWPLLLVVNFGIGAYVLTRTTSKSKGSSETEDNLEADTKSASTPTPSVSTAEKPLTPPITPSIVDQLVRTPIPEDQQRDLFKWILEEKRKVKPRDAKEKKRVDEEKAILKHFIRSKSIPNL